MASRLRRALAPAVACAAALAACAPPRPAPPTPASPLPPLDVEVPAVVPTRPLPRAAHDPLAKVPPGRPTTLSARDVDVRALLTALSEAAGVSLVIDPAVQGRITVSLIEVPAREALRAVLAQAGLAIAPPPPGPLWEPVVFYTLPVDIERASVPLIQARFGVSAELARWIVENRVAAPR